MAYTSGVPNDDLRTCPATIKPTGLPTMTLSLTDAGITVNGRGKQKAIVSVFIYLGVATAVVLSCNPTSAAPFGPQGTSGLNHLTVQAQMPQPYLGDQGNAYPYYGRPQQALKHRTNPNGPMLRETGDLIRDALKYREATTP
jgi:hypothetical protein